MAGEHVSDKNPHKGGCPHALPQADAKQGW
jgi:hypothetical protein